MKSEFFVLNLLKIYKSTVGKNCEGRNKTSNVLFVFNFEKLFFKDGESVFFCLASCTDFLPLSDHRRMALTSLGAGTH